VLPEASAPRAGCAGSLWSCPRDGSRPRRSRVPGLATTVPTQGPHGLRSPAAMAAPAPGQNTEPRPHRRAMAGSARARACPPRRRGRCTRGSAASPRAPPGPLPERLLGPSLCRWRSRPWGPTPRPPASPRVAPHAPVAGPPAPGAHAVAARPRSWPRRRLPRATRPPRQPGRGRARAASHTRLTALWPPRTRARRCRGGPSPRAVA
jgi:hypothetical protein